MSSRKYDYAVVIGRFQPIHKGHQYLLQHALDIADEVIVLCGSANQPRTIKNPWTVEERNRMISLAFPDDFNRMKIRGIEDYYTTQQWTLAVQKNVDSIIFNGFRDSPSVCLIGHKKDSETEEYLDMFPQYSYLEVKREGPIDATDLREMYFHYHDELFQKAIKGVICDPVKKFLVAWRGTKEYNALQEEWNAILNGKALWKFAPYEPKFITSDAVVIESGHILLIQRGEYPGKGQWALPGGHLDPEDINLKECAIRELREETKLKVPTKVLRGSIISEKVFDEKDRDPRGRYVTHAFYFSLASCPTGGLTPVKGSDDAVKAKWFPLVQLEIMRDQLFLDHYIIIKTMLGEK